MCAQIYAYSSVYKHTHMYEAYIHAHICMYMLYMHIYDAVPILYMNACENIWTHICDLHV